MVLRCCVCAFLFALPAAAAETARPNIVFILADDLGWADVAFHGGNVPTPHLNRLAREGLELTRHYVAPVCTPTRVSLMTGRSWSRFGVTAPQNERVLPWDTLTLPRALQHVGYETCLTGKWHLGSLPEHGPQRFGFDHSYGSLAGGVSPWNHRYKQGPYSRTWHRQGQLVEEPGHVTDLIAAEAVQWISARGDSPFFLYVPFTAVHLPIKEPAEWLARVPTAIEGDVPRHYAASIMHLDDAVGRILTALEAADHRDRTLVVFTSDNGGSTAENNDLKYPDDNCPSGPLTGNNLPWRGKKADLYEGGTRVPTLVSWPERVQPGQLDAPVQIIDWMPTLCTLVGYRPAEGLQWDGIDLTPLLTRHEPAPDRAIYAVAPGWQARSLHWGDWKLIAYGTGDERRLELYHLSRDPAETDNLADRHPAQVIDLLQRMDEAAAADMRSIAD
jgi:arylsulfatase A-like enzyme